MPVLAEVLIGAIGVAQSVSMNRSREEVVFVTMMEGDVPRCAG